jgi:hypothetical protein
MKEIGAEATEIAVTTLDFKEPGCVGCYRFQNLDEYMYALNDKAAGKSGYSG